MMVFVSALTMGLMLAPLALGVFITFRIFGFPDITTDGSFATGAAVALALIHAGVDPLIATALGVAGGACAGVCTGVVHTSLRVNRLLAGIIVMTALYSINIFIMGRSAIVVVNERTLVTSAASFASSVFPGSVQRALSAVRIPPQEIVMLAGMLFIAVGTAVCLHLFFRTHLGLAIRASGENERMVSALGIDTRITSIVGLAIANALVALSGAIFAQYYGSTNAQAGIGMIVNGLISVIVGQVIAGRSRFATTIYAMVGGAVLVRLLIALILQAEIPGLDIKLLSALFLVIALLIPRIFRGTKLATLTQGRGAHAGA